MNNSKKIVLSVFIILWGVVLLIKHLNIIPYDLEEIFFNWKTFLIALGIFLLFYSKGKTFAAVLIVIGTWFWLDDVVGFSMFSFKIFLPTLLIFAGCYMLISEIRKKKTFENINLSPDFIDDSVVFSAHKLAINSKNFKGGRINVAFGTTTLILNSAEIAEGQHVLEVSAVFGSVKILTPQGMNVKLINSSVLGQFNDRRIYPSSNEDTKLLIIKSNVVFAGGDLI